MENNTAKRELSGAKVQGNNYDVIVIGAGHNGLVTAGYLAKAGYKVLVLEKREMIGGAAVKSEDAEKIGAIYGKTKEEAVAIAKKILEAKTAK